MKVLSLISSADVGGAEVHVEHIASHLPARHVIVTLSEGPMVERYRAVGATVYVLPTPGKMPLKTLPDLEQILAAEKPDVIHTHTPKANLMGALLRSSPKRVMTIHGSHKQFVSSRSIPAAWYKWADMWASKHCHAVITVCESDRRELVDAGFSSVRTVVIPNGVPDAWAEGIPSRPPGEIVWVGRMSPEKAPETMLHLARMFETHPLVDHVRMIGHGPLLPLMARGIAKLVIEPPRPSLDSVWPETTVIVNTSRSEGASLVLLEALAAGVPIVASAVGGNPEVVGNAGILVSGIDGSDSERAGQFAAAVKKLIEDNSFRSEISNRARARYHERFRIETMVEKLAGVYDEARRR